MERVRRRWWTVIVTVGALVVVLGALATASFQLVMMIAPGYRDDISDYVSRIAGQPVDIGGVGLGWYGVSPRLELTDITLYEDDGESPALSADRLRLGFGWARLLHGDTTPERIELAGLELVAQIDETGHVTVRGLDTTGTPTRGKQDWLRQVARFQRIRLSNCQVQVEDARLPGPAPTFRLASASISFRNGRGKASADLELPPAIGSSVEVEARVTGDPANVEGWNGTWEAHVEKLAGIPWLDAALGSGASIGFADTSLQLGGSIESGHLGAVSLDLQAGQVLGRRGPTQAGVRDVRVSAHVRPDGRGWLAEIDRLGMTGAAGAWPVTHARVRWEGGDAPSLDASAEYLDLRDVAPWLPFAPSPEIDDDAAHLTRVSGTVRGLVVRWRGNGDGPRFSLRADLGNLALGESPQIPGFSGLSGEISATESEGRFALREGPFALRYPKVFTQDLTFERISGDLAWTRGAEGWNVQMPRFGWMLDGSKGEGGFQLLIPHGQGSPRLNLDARFSAEDVTRLKPYMPLVWGDSLRKWLTDAVMSGRAPSARLKIAGDLADFPFADKPGTFALDLDVANGTLAFLPEWPAVEELDAHLEFRGSSLTVSGDSGALAGNHVEHVQATIPDLHAGQLNITGEMQGDAAKFYDLLRRSPLATKLSGLLTRTAATGEAAVLIRLGVPLHAAHDTTVAGTIRLNDAQLAVNGIDEPVRAIRGDLSFSGSGVSADKLSAQMYGTPLTVGIAPGADGNERLAGTFDFAPDAEGTGVSRLVPAFLRSRMSGRSAAQVALALSGPDANRVRITTDLRGVALDLPKPFQKNADEAWPLALEVAGDADYPVRLGLDMQERFGGDLAFKRDANALHLVRGLLRVGGEPGVPRATQDGLQIVGTVADLDPIGWVAAVKSPADHGPPSPPGPALRADLNVGRLWLGGQSIEGTRLTYEPTATGSTVRLSGSGAGGELAYRESADGGQLVGRFDHLHFAARPLHPEPTAPTDLPPAELPPPKPSPPSDPGKMPTLDLASDDVEIGNSELGRLEIRTIRIVDGQRIERFSSRSGGIAFDAFGEWRRSAGRSSAILQTDFDGKGIADVLQSFGYAPNLTAKRSHIAARIVWPETLVGAPRGLDWAQGEGRIEFDIDKGMLRAVEPGAGRVLGLMNFYALPRRLTLDFKDVTSKGLAFDQIKGTFALGNGIANTNDLEIKAPALKMEVRGRVGLAARDYDQRITVYPDVSSGVTLGALLLGGPAAGALALLAQTVLDQPLDQMTQLSYRLTGKWDDPEIVRESSTPKAPPLPAAAAVSTPEPVSVPTGGSDTAAPPAANPAPPPPSVPAPVAVPETAPEEDPGALSSPADSEPASSP